MEKRVEHSVFWIDFQSPLLSVSPSHAHTPAHHPSPSLVTHTYHRECHCLKGQLGGVLSLLIKSQTGGFLPTHSSLCRSFLERRLNRTAEREVWWTRRNRWVCILPFCPSSHTSFPVSGQAEGLKGQGPGGPATRRLGFRPALYPALLFSFPQVSNSFPLLPPNPILGHLLLPQGGKAKHLPPGITHSPRRQESL